MLSDHPTMEVFRRLWIRLPSSLPSSGTTAFSTSTQNALKGKAHKSAGCKYWTISMRGEETPEAWRLHHSPLFEHLFLASLLHIMNWGSTGGKLFTNKQGSCSHRCVEPSLNGQALVSIPCA